MFVFNVHYAENVPCGTDPQLLLRKIYIQHLDQPNKNSKLGVHHNVFQLVPNNKRYE